MRISVCIPHYNRIDYLLQVLESIESQTYGNLEVIVSDDCSTDNSERVLMELTATHKLDLIYERQTQNIGYDANLRRSLELASGDFLFVLGNDDALASNTSIQELADLLAQHDCPGVVTTNYHEFGDPEIIHRRVSQTECIPGTMESALANYSCFSFVAGIGFRKDVFDDVNTNAHDGSIYAQIFLAVAAMMRGHNLLKIEIPLVAKDILTDGEKSNSYRDKIAKNWSDMTPVTGGLLQVASVLFAAIDASSSTEAETWKRRVALKLYGTTYPFWLLDYRRHGALPESIRLMRGLLPSRNRPVLQTVIGWRLWVRYITSTLIGLTFPVFIFNRIENRLYARIKAS